jgi:RNA polymerase sigma-70 factor (ECF subfamily)
MNSDRIKLDGLRDLDPQVITDAHQRYFPEIFRYARYRVGDELLAEDIASEAFTRLLEACQMGRGPRKSLRGWLIGTASNLVNDHLRHRYNYPTESLMEQHDLHPGVEPLNSASADEGSPLQYTENSERQQALRAALAKLTVDQQQVIALRFGAGYSLEETALMMDKKANAIKALQFRALAALRRTIGGEI